MFYRRHPPKKMKAAPPSVVRLSWRTFPVVWVFPIALDVVVRLSPCHGKESTTTLLIARFSRGAVSLPTFASTIIAVSTCGASHSDAE